jgi:CRP-like cAMP-binding protein
MDKKEILKSIELLEGLSDDQLALVLPATEIVSFKEGEKVFSVGEEAEDIFILLEGKISIQVKLTSRPETVGIVVLQNRGQLIGWSGLIGGSHYTAEGFCQGESKLVKLDGTVLMRALEEDTCTGFYVMREITKVVSNRIRNLQSVVLKTI